MNHLFQNAPDFNCSFSPLSLWMEDICVDIEWKFLSGFLHSWCFIYVIPFFNIVSCLNSIVLQQAVLSKYYILEINIPNYSKWIYVMITRILTESTYCLFANIAHLISVVDNLKWSGSIIEIKFSRGIKNIFTNRVLMCVQCDP